MKKIDGALRQEVVRTRQAVQDRVQTTENLLGNIRHVESVLEKERDDVMEQIDSRVTIIRSLIDQYVLDTQTMVLQMHKHNYDVLKSNENDIEKQLEDDKENVRKLNDITEQLKKPGGHHVNALKVFEMVLESIENIKGLPANIGLFRAKLAPSELGDDMAALIKVLGKVQQTQESLSDIIFPITLVGEFKTPDIEINALSSSNTELGKANISTCFGVKKELMNYNLKGKVLRKVVCDFKVNDIIQTPDGQVFATSPDKKCIYCMSRRKSSDIYNFRVLVEDSLYLHGLTLGTRVGIMTVCGTDTPNYSDTIPGETVIVELTLTGKELRRVMVSNFTGKVYRIAQNINNDYILSFPKEGAVLCVDNVGNIRHSLRKRTFKEYAVGIMTKGGDNFWPSGLTCDKAGHVLVSEWTHRLVLMLDEHLQILRCVGHVHKGPNSLSYDPNMNVMLLGDKGRVQLWKTCADRKDR